jgi:hypothetical protein
LARGSEFDVPGGGEMPLLFTGPQNLPPSSEEWLTKPEVIAAIITSIFTLAGITLKDFALKLWEERRSSKRQQSAIYERYSVPLVNAAISLQDRLYEILHELGRPVYLLGKLTTLGTNPGSEYRSYKKLSTAYRLAAVIGWVRACRREFSFLRVADPGQAEEIHEAVEAFETALADGTWVEHERLWRLCELWLLCKREDIDKRPNAKELGTLVDNLIWDHLEKAGVEDLSLLNEAAQRELCRSVANCLSSNLKTNPIAAGSIDRSWEDAFAILSMREAWIYRDWQSAIGDVMIRKSESEARRFEIIGFGDFEQLIFASDTRTRLALERLLNVFDQLNLTIDDRYDARPKQLRAVAKATSNLILAGRKFVKGHFVVPEYSIKRASEITGTAKASS